MTCYLKLCCFKQLLLYQTQRAMSKCVLKYRFITRCLAISHNRKLSICSSVDFWIAPPWSIHLCARQLVPQALQYFRALTLLINMAEKRTHEASVTIDFWHDYVYGTFSQSMFCWQKRKSMGKWLQQVKRLGERLKRRNTAGFFSGYPMPALRSPATWVATSPCLKNPITHFWSHKTSVCQFFLVNPIILKLIWFESRQQEETEFNKPSRPTRSVQYVFLHDV